MSKITEYAIIERDTKKVFALSTGSTRIGRNSANNIKINHQLCSKFHSTITIRGDIIHYHDFSSTGSRVLKRLGFKKLLNETTRLYEHSKIRIANKEYKVIKLKNLKNEQSEIINIDDSDNETEKIENTNKISEYDGKYEWKKMKSRKLNLKSAVHDESNEQNNFTNESNSDLEVTTSQIKKEKSDDESIESETEIKQERFENQILSIKTEPNDKTFDFDLHNQ